MPTTHTLTLGDGRTLGYADYGPPEGVAVLWCHGGPGSRFASAQMEEAAGPQGLRIIGIDRPGYGLSTPKPGRTIGEWPLDALAVMDALGIDQFLAVGASTGGAYALAVAAHSPARVLGVVAACAMTDMRWDAAKQQMMSGLPVNAAVWTAADRTEALALAGEVLGEDGSKTAALLSSMVLPAADLRVLQSGAYLGDSEADRASYAFGLEGLVDDRLADGGGWTTFDVRKVSAPVVVLHGEEDTFVHVAQARHTASMVAGARLQVLPRLGHLSIASEVVPALKALLSTSQ